MPFGVLAQPQAPGVMPPQLRQAAALINDFGNTRRYAAENAAVKPPAAGEQRVVFMGDSITDNMHNAQRFGPFFPGKPYFNRGIALQTTPQMLVRFRQDVIDLQPKVVVIEGGFNDIGMVMGPGSEGTISDNLVTMIELAKLHGIKVVIASLTPVCDCYDTQTRLRPVGKIAAINATLRDLAKSTGSVYLNYYSVLVDTAAGTRQMKKELTGDGVNPNDAAYALMAPLADKAIADALATK